MRYTIMLRCINGPMKGEVVAVDMPTSFVRIATCKEFSSRDIDPNNAFQVSHTYLVEKISDGGFFLRWDDSDYF